MCDLAGLHTLEGEAQPGFVLPADLDRRQRPAIKTESVIEQLDPIEGQFAGDLHHIFLLERGGIVLQLARHMPVLGKHQQAGRIPLQRYALRQPDKVLLEQVDAGRIVSRARVGANQLLRGIGIHARRQVKQNGCRLNRREARFGVELDFLLRYHELRLFHHLPINRYPAASDIKFGLAARAGDGFGKAFCEADGGWSWEVRLGIKEPHCKRSSPAIPCKMKT